MPSTAPHSWPAAGQDEGSSRRPWQGPQASRPQSRRPHPAAGLGEPCQAVPFLLPTHRSSDRKSRIDISLLLLPGGWGQSPDTCGGAGRGEGVWREGTRVGKGPPHFNVPGESQGS